MTQTQTTAEALEVMTNAAGHACLSFDKGEVEDALVLAWQAARDAEAITRVAVSEARIKGLSWSQIGTALNMSKQAAQQRYGRA